MFIFVRLLPNVLYKVQFVLCMNSCQNHITAHLQPFSTHASY